MLKRITVLFTLVVLLAAVGCTAQTQPAPVEPEAGAVTPEPAIDTVDSATPTADPTVESTPSIEPTAEIPATDTPESESIEESLPPELLETPQQQDAVTPLPEEDIVLELNPTKPSPEQMQQISFARRDLAERLGVDLADIEVAAYETVIWRDGSLGCPQPGMMYTQALVDGYLIQLVVDGQAYNYHGANGRDPFLCVKDGGESGDLPRSGYLATPPPSDEDV